MKGLLLFVSTLLVLATSQCPGQNLLPLPRDPAVKGPWPVGEKTVFITERNLTVEIFYPAIPGSQRGKEQVVYSVRDEWLPPFQAQKIPDEENPFQPIDAYFDLPIDNTRGPYPIHLHVHGTAAWRTASAHQFTHFASRGFIVISADHPGINLKDMLSFQTGKVDQEGDARLMLREMAALSDPQLAFLRGHVDASRVVLSGHSAGGGAVGNMADVAQVVIPWCSRGVQGKAQSSLVLGGVDDTIVRYSSQQRGYETSFAPKRLVGIGNSGHMVPTDICWIGRDMGGIVEIAKRNGIWLAYLYGPLGEDGCDDEQVKDEEAWEIVNYVNTAAQEEVLYCDRQMADALRDLSSRYPQVDEYREEL